MEERRQYLRLEKPIKLKLQILRQPLWDGSNAEDISAGGIRLGTSKRFPPGLGLRIQIFLPLREKPIAATGEVVWRKEKRDPKLPFEVGIKFVDINPYEREELYNYVGRHSRQEG